VLSAPALRNAGCFRGTESTRKPCRRPDVLIRLSCRGRFRRRGGHNCRNARTLLPRPACVVVTPGLRASPPLGCRLPVVGRPSRRCRVLRND